MQYSTIIILKHSKIISILQNTLVYSKHYVVLLVQVLYGDGGSPRVVESIHGLHLEHEHSGTVEDDQQDQHRDDTHQGNMAKVALTVVR